jgi:hypothetical protein
MQHTSDVSGRISCDIGVQPYDGTRLRWAYTAAKDGGYGFVRINSANEDATTTGVGSALVQHSIDDALTLHEPGTRIAEVSLDAEDVIGETYFVETRLGGPRAIVTARTGGYEGPIFRVLEYASLTESQTANPHLMITFGGDGDGERLEEVFVDRVPFAPPADLVFFDSFSRDDSTASLGDAEYPYNATWTTPGTAADVTSGVATTSNSTSRYNAASYGNPIAYEGAVLRAAFRLSDYGTAQGDKVEVRFDCDASGIGVGLGFRVDGPNDVNQCGQAESVCIKEGNTIVSPAVSLGGSFPVDTWVFAELTVTGGVADLTIRENGYDGNILLSTQSDQALVGSAGRSHVCVAILNETTGAPAVSEVSLTRDLP